MNCEQSQQWMLPYLDRDLDSESAAALEAHLATCDACHYALADLRAFTSEFAHRYQADLDRLSAPPQAWEALQARLAQPELANPKTPHTQSANHRSPRTLELSVTLTQAPLRRQPMQKRTLTLNLLAVGLVAVLVIAVVVVMMPRDHANIAATEEPTTPATVGTQPPLEMTLPTGQPAIEVIAPEKITDLAGSEFLLDWSPDGTQMLFANRPVGTDNRQLYIVNADGSGLVQITEQAELYFAGDWSPDGQRIAFISNRDNTSPNTKGMNAEIYVMNRDGTGVVRLTDHPGYDFDPVWSPDGTRIAFVGESRGIYVVNADGSRLLRLSADLEASQGPMWSPDGSKIAFISIDTADAAALNDAPIVDIYVVNPDGTGLINLTDDFTPDAFGPISWSPDGSQLVHAGQDENGISDLYLTNGDGSGHVRLTSHEADETVPLWSPTGEYIVFSSNRSGDYDLWLMRPDGSDLRRLYLPGSNEYGWSVRWSPDGQHLAFDDSGEGGQGDIYRLSVDSFQRVDETAAVQPTPIATAQPAIIDNGLELVFDQPGYDQVMAISPDGEWMVLSNWASGGSKSLYLVKSDGSESRPLYYDEPYYRYVDWSPDGRKLLLQLLTDEASLTYNTFVYDLETREFTQLTDRPLNEHPPIYNDTAPRWSPDGTRILYIGEQDREMSIFVMNADGSGVTKLTDDLPIYAQALWSPDGSKIAFTTMGIPTGTLLRANLYVMNADGSGLVQLAKQIAGHDLSWSPDGSQLVYSKVDPGGATEQFPHGNYNLYIVNVVSGESRQLTTSEANDYYAVWSPDGQYIAFGSDRADEEGGHMWLIRPDGTDLRRLTIPRIGIYPYWSPDSQSLILDQLVPFVEYSSISGRSESAVYRAYLTDFVPVDMIP